MIITSYITDYHVAYRIRRDEKSPEVLVSKNKKMLSEEWTETMVNWPGCGDMPEIKTDSFIHVLSVASNICNELANGINPAEGQYRNYLK
jgi:Gpi18-like mannosyltransferase